MSKLWNYRKTLSDFPITPQDEAIFKNFTLKFEDKKSITDKTTENLNRINTQHLLDELDALKSKGPQERGYGFEVWLNELFKTFNLSPENLLKLMESKLMVVSSLITIRTLLKPNGTA
ncbi:hypothetical protein NX009_29415 [Klebsiella pneumoniae]|nr:hypothetical protein [Klebsiella pneumoniae]